MTINGRQQPEYYLRLHKGQAVFMRGDRAVQEFQGVSEKSEAAIPLLQIGCRSGERLSFPVPRR